MIGILPDNSVNLKKIIEPTLQSYNEESKMKPKIIIKGTVGFTPKEKVKIEFLKMNSGEEENNNKRNLPLLIHRRNKKRRNHRDPQIKRILSSRIKT